MSRNLRQLVSKKKRRYDDGEFNLDLSYITSQVIAMGVPAETFERFYRNDISEVAKFLETHHPDRYKVYNLCAERSYNHAKFKDRVEQFAMQDHNPPLIHTIPYFCTSVYKWLQNGPDHVAAIHCKAGKGRTGVMICCYLLYESYQGMREQEPTRLTADQVLDLYDKRRTHNKKGVTIPSQRRYVYYYAHVLRHNLVVESCPLVLRSVSVEGGLPSYPPSGGCCLFFRCQKLVRDFHQDNRSAHRPIGESEMCEPKRGQQSAIIPMSAPIKVNGDVKIVFYNRSKVLALCEELFHCWFNTFFVLNQPQDTPGALWRRRKREAAGLAPDEQDDKYLYLTLTKSELDKACKDKMFPDTFCVTLQFELPDPNSSDEDNPTDGLYRPFSYCSAPASSSAGCSTAAATASSPICAGALVDTRVASGRCRLRRRRLAPRLSPTPRGATARWMAMELIHGLG
ncbi:hypothetical protein BOX15_Mlig004651g2 [Macrostomum lignano]|uniref:Phosphatidylinositol 3,4,5-trisphosphate 3-phosphatase and dual-specificity protein phosphatase PTEN n=1 Tax=Macrostomum lignano TaxID=282301 RepID=A0A267DPK9_9PLAT|nr:hypothetical protein BOX15_Mlig004651g2 [Macrostomum lignano]